MLESVCVSGHFMLKVIRWFTVSVFVGRNTWRHKKVFRNPSGEKVLEISSRQMQKPYLK